MIKKGAAKMNLTDVTEHQESRKLCPWITCAHGKRRIERRTTMNDKKDGLLSVHSNDRLSRKYTFIQPCVVEGSPDAHTVWLKVGVQSFCVTHLACDTKDEAKWMQKMLVKALARIILNER